MTYTIIARDKATGHFGIATQTCNLGVGAWVPWGQGGVGVVATQARALRTYGTSGLALMGRGHHAQDALHALLAVDADRDFRQVAMIDRTGTVAVHTGDRCLAAAGAHVGDQFCTLANMVQRDTVWGAMAEAYEKAEGDFASRLLPALHAAQVEGGDLRGQQTAALLIVDGQPNPIPLTDLRVDYDPDPVAKLTHIVHTNRAYTAEYAISPLVRAGRRDEALAIVDFILDTALSEPYLIYLCALHLAGELDSWQRATALLRQLCDDQPVWHEYLARDAAVDNFGIDGLGQRLLSALES